MVNFTDEDILRLDEAYAMNGVPFHMRPFQAAMQILGGEFSIGVGGNPQVAEIKTAYARLIPEVDFTWPGMGSGLVASLDRVKKVTIGVAFGSPVITVAKGLGFRNDEEWSLWCRNDSEIKARSAFSFADMNDLVYGIDRFSGDTSVSTFLGLSAKQIGLVSESLSQSGAISGVSLQPICLAVELALKGALLKAGLTKEQLKSREFGHNLNKLGERMALEIPHRDDQLIFAALAKFPDYINERYRETELSRIGVISLAIDAQFIAASVVRRLSGRDMALQMEAQGLARR